MANPPAENQLPALKLLVSQLDELSQVEGGYQLGALPHFDRVWVQGTVKRKVSNVIKLDDGTGLLDLLVTSSAAAAPGSDAASVGPGAYVLVQGRLQARPQPGGAALEYSVKVQKLLNLTKQCGEDAAQRMLSWGTEVAELQRLLEAEAAAPAAA